MLKSGHPTRTRNVAIWAQFRI